MKPVVVLLFLVCAISSNPAAASDLPIFPKPRQIEVRDEWLKLNKSIPILLPQRPSSDDLSLGRFLTAELSDRYGVALQMKQVAGLPETGPFILLGSVSNPLVRQYCSRHSQPPSEREGYSLNVDHQEVVVAGNDASGAFYGLQSLRQLIQRSRDGVRIRALTVRDWPFKPFRGLKLYLPGQENIPFFKRFVRDVMAPCKYNTLILEMNAAMRLDRHPELNAGWIEFGKDLRYTRRERSWGPGKQFQDSANSDSADGGVLEKEEVSELVQFVRQHHIDVIPEIPSLTHSYYLLTRHRELAEIPEAEWPDTYCPSEPAVYRLLFDVFDEYIEVMKPLVIHVGHDEWRMPLGVCPRCKGKDPTELYAADLNRIYSHLSTKGIATAIYGDHLIEALRGRKTKHNDNPGGQPYDMPGALSPEQVKRLIPKDILIFNWFWDSKGNEDLDEQGIGPQNEVNLSNWGFRQVFGNFEPHIANFDNRASLPGIIGGAPSAWAATTTLNMGKDMMFSVLGCANLLWSTDRPDMTQLSLMIQQRMPELRSALSSTGLPSQDDVAIPAPLKAEKDPTVQIEADVSSLIFLHACSKRGRIEPAYMATWNFADTAELLGWYEVMYNDGFIETVPLRYGVNILEADWNKGSGSKSLAYEARLAHRSDGRLDFAFEWVNPRFGIPIREVRLRSVSSENPVTLSGVHVVHKRPTGLGRNEHQEK
ncbi:MAG TPA: beta-N-acetylhexosaminidase [Terriglobia bacterium]|nr:beta-N-acetylhexosaminidase [Terriglobia bacterium]